MATKIREIISLSDKCPDKSRTNVQTKVGQMSRRRSDKSPDEDRTKVQTKIGQKSRQRSDKSPDKSRTNVQTEVGQMSMVSNKYNGEYNNDRNTSY